MGQPDGSREYSGRTSFCSAGQKSLETFSVTGGYFGGGSRLGGVGGISSSDLVGLGVARGAALAKGSSPSSFLFFFPPSLFSSLFL